MNLLVKVFRKTVLFARKAFYKSLSDAKVEGSFCAVSPVLCEGRGYIKVGSKVVFGFEEDCGFWNSIAFLNPRHPESFIKIGDETRICNHFTAISEGPGIEIGSRVLIGTDVSIMDSDFHAIAPDQRIKGIPKMGRVSIADNVWIGDHVTILKGTVIGENSIVAAGAVVAGTFPANVVIGGIPAKVIRNI